MDIVVAALLAGVIGSIGPAVVRRLPEPAPHPDDPVGQLEEKIRYAELGSPPRTELVVAGLAALLAGVAAQVTQTPALLPALVVFCGVGSWLTWVDWRTRLLPYLITAPVHVVLVLLVLGAAIVEDDWSVLWRGLLGNAVVFAVFWLIWFVGARVGSTFGYGDVRLAGILGLVLGPFGLTATLAGTYAGFLLGAVGGILLSWWGVVDRKGFAFGPYMVVGAIVGLSLAPLF